MLLLGTAMVGAVIWLASGGAFQKKFDLYLAIETEPVAGLNVHAPVKYNGVDVGKVRTIRLDPKNPERVQLVFAIERGTPINQDTLAVLKAQGLTGIAYVELEGGGPDSLPLQAAAPGELPEIRTKPSLSARLENVLTSVLAKLDETSANVNALLGPENRAALSQTLADIAAVAHTLAERRAALDAGIADAARTFEHTARLTAQMGPVIEQLRRSGAALEQMGNDAASASTGAGKTVTAVGADVRHLTTELLPDLQRMLGELDALSRSVRRLSDQTERNPAQFVIGRGPIPEGPGELSRRKEQRQ